MSNPFLGQITMFAGNFAPRGWSFCDGQLLAISGNSALFSLLGTIYGGDGRTTFGLPDLRGRVPIHAGTGPGLTNKRIGSKSGSETVGLNIAQIPGHSHAGGAIPVVDLPATSTDPAGRAFAIPTDGHSLYASPAAGTETFGAIGGSGNAGGSQPHTNLQPFQCVHFIIAVQGIFPSRN